MLADSIASKTGNEVNSSKLAAIEISPGFHLSPSKRGIGKMAATVKLCLWVNVEVRGEVEFSKGLESGREQASAISLRRKLR